MVSGPFRLLLYVVATVALLYIFYAYLLPYFLPQQDVIKDMGKALEAAEFNEGKAMRLALQFRGNFGINAKAFESDARSVGFQCNDVSVCCFSEAKGCKLIIDQRTLFAKENASAETFARCVHEKVAKIAICKIYFGKKPAQLEIENFSAERKVDLKKGKPLLQFEIKNSGLEDAENVSIEITAQKGLEKTPVFSEKVRTVAKLEAGQTFTDGFSLQLEEAGSYQVELKVSAENAGFEVKRLDIEVIGETVAPEKCIATNKGGFELKNDNCIQRLNCSNCSAAYECSLAWQGKGINADKITDRYADHINVLLDISECA